MPFRVEPSARERDRRTGWFVGPTMLLGTACAILLVLRGADRAFAVAAGLLLATAVAWILVSVFWPGTPDRACPECGKDGLKRLDPGSMRGVVCTECGTTDADRSSFLFAEAEDEAIEPAVVRDRGRREALRR